MHQITEESLEDAALGIVDGTETQSWSEFSYLLEHSVKYALVFSSFFFPLHQQLQNGETGLMLFPNTMGYTKKLSRDIIMLIHKTNNGLGREKETSLKQIKTRTVWNSGQHAQSKAKAQPSLHLCPPHPHTGSMAPPANAVPDAPTVAGNMTWEGCEWACFTISLNQVQAWCSFHSKQHGMGKVLRLRINNPIHHCTQHGSRADQGWLERERE